MKVLRHITDEELKLVAGTDAALYIIFIRYAAIFFLYITLINSIIFLPIYVTGSPINITDIIETEKDGKNKTIVIALLTSINITGIPVKQIIVFVTMIIFYTLGAFLLMYFYWRRSMSWRRRKHSHKETFYD
jgi:hypothetical protein